MGIGRARYSIDSSSLIWCKNRYPIDVFPSLWDALDQLIANGILVAHEEVWIEINAGSDALTTWASTRKAGLCIEADANQIAIVQRIAAEFPLANYLTTTEHRADPWVVALAHAQSLNVVSEEVRANSRIPKVPSLCDTGRHAERRMGILGNIS